MSSMSRTIRRSIEREHNPQPRQYARRGKGRSHHSAIANLLNKLRRQVPK